MQPIQPTFAELLNQDGAQSYSADQSQLLLPPGTATQETPSRDLHDIEAQQEILHKGNLFHLPAPSVQVQPPVRLVESTDSQTKDDAKSIFIQTLVIALIETGKYSDTKAEQIATKLIEENQRYHSTNGLPDETSREYIKFVKQINNTTEAYQKLRYCSRILQIYTKPEEGSMRESQLEAVARIIKSVPMGANRDITTVSNYRANTYADMLRKVQEFLVNINDAAEGIILFNGDGNESGLRFANSDHRYIDSVSKDIYAIRKQLRDVESLVDVPLVVRLIYAQCWANLATRPDCSINGFQIVTLSSTSDPETTNTYVPVTVNGAAPSDQHHHLELEEWAKVIASDYEQYLSRTSS